MLVNCDTSIKQRTLTKASVPETCELNLLLVARVLLTLMLEFLGCVKQLFHFWLDLRRDIIISSYFRVYVSVGHMLRKDQEDNF